MTGKPRHVSGLPRQVLTASQKARPPEPAATADRTQIQQPMIALSLGAGVQSSTMALMAACGELTPMPECAIFADTQAEPASVYRWLDWLEAQLPFPIHRVTRGSLTEGALKLRHSKGGKDYATHAIPAFIVDEVGKTGLMMRQCTADFKIEVIQREVRRLRAGRQVVQWIGITLDEAHRMKPSRVKYITNRWPLVFDVPMTRHACLQWMKSHGFPAPPRSACVYCPYHGNTEWQRMKTEEPEEFAKAVRFEAEYAETYRNVHNFRGTPFLHRSLIPLSQVDFADGADGPNLFGNECEGMCGV